MMKTAVVTGATSGIGLTLTKRLLGEGWAVAALVRRPMPADRDLIGAERHSRLRIYRGDLADAASRRSAVSEIAAAEPCIDLLFNNAGVSTGTLQFSSQRRELHFEVNCIAPYVLVAGLRANLATSGRGRVVNTLSDAIRFVRRYDPNTLAQPPRFRVVTGPYASTKLALALWSQAIGPELARDGISIVSAAPGPNDTPLIRGPGFPRLLRPLARLIAKSPSHGAGLLLDAAQGHFASGDLVINGEARPLPFTAQADRTLAIVATAAAEAG